MSSKGKKKSSGAANSAAYNRTKDASRKTSRRAMARDRLAAGGLAWFLVICIVVLLTVVIRQQMNISDQLAEEDAKLEKIEAEAAINVYRSSLLDFDYEADHTYVIDDVVIESATDALPTEGAAALSAHWVKQAGIHLVKAEAAYEENRLGTAIEHYQAALKIFPDLTELIPFIGLIQVQQGFYDDAILTLDNAVKAGLSSAELHNNLGVAHLALENFDAAAQALSQALELNPDYALAHYNLAAMHYKQKQYEAASGAYKTYLAKNPGHLEAVQAYADSLVQLERWEDAVPQLQQLTAEDPDAAAPHFILAQSLGMIGQFDEGMDVLKHGIVLVGSRNALAWMARDEFDPFREHENFVDLFDQLVESTNE